MKKITKRSAMEMLNDEVKLIGAYFGMNAETIENAIVNCKDLKELLGSLETRTCFKQSSNQIVFLKENKEKTYLGTVGWTWYLTEIDNFKFILLENEREVICYNIVK